METVKMTTGICDMHCHILPKLDDGSKSMDETIQAIEEGVRQGIRTMIATPHFYPGRYEADVQTILQKVENIQLICQEQNLPVRLYAGQECFYYSGLLEQLKEGSVLTLAGSRYVLVEFSPDCIYSQLFYGLSELIRGGYLPVLAHFERYECLRKEERLKELKDAGILLQMNYDTLLQRGLFGKTRWRTLMKSGMVDLLGSDCHGMMFRPYHVDEACRWLEKNVDPKLRQRMLVRNVQKILNRD